MADQLIPLQLAEAVQRHRPVPVPFFQLSLLLVAATALVDGRLDPAGREVPVAAALLVTLLEMIFREAVVATHHQSAHHKVMAAGLRLIRVF